MADDEFEESNLLDPDEAQRHLTEPIPELYTEEVYTEEDESPVDSGVITLDKDDDVPLEEEDKLIEDFRAMYAYPPVKHITEEITITSAGQIYFAVVELNKSIIVCGPNADNSPVVSITLKTGYDYIIVCRDTHHLNLKTRKRNKTDTITSPAHVRFFTFANDNEMFPEIPMRLYQSYYLMMFSGIKYQFRVFAEDIPRSLLNSIPADFVLPLFQTYGDPYDTGIVTCKLNVTTQLRIEALPVVSMGFEVKMTSEPIAIPEPVPLPQLPAGTEEWMVRVHNLNKELCFITGFGFTKFPKIKKNNQVDVSSKTLNAFQLQASQKVTVISKLSKQSEAQVEINANVRPGCNYLLIRRTNEIWTLTCGASVSPTIPPALIRVVTVATSAASQTYPIRPNNPCIVLVRSGKDCSVRLIPDEVETALIRKLDYKIPSVDVDVEPREVYLRCELITIYTIRVTNPTPNTIKVANVFVTDMKGTGAREFERMALLSTRNYENVIAADDHQYGKNVSSDNDNNY